MQSKNPLEVNILIVVIAQEGNFIRASKKLGITPPSLTRRVSSLERSIGVKLFDRSTRNVQLTTAGRLFVQESSISIMHAERAWDLARFQAQIETGPYRIGYSPYTHSAFLPLLSGLSPVRHPPGDEPSGIVLETANTLELVERVLRGKASRRIGCWANFGPGSVGTAGWPGRILGLSAEKPSAGPKGRRNCARS
jgi:DNA-binding transcriptional LysR family regulator